MENLGTSKYRPRVLFREVGRLQSEGRSIADIFLRVWRTVGIDVS